MFAVEVQAAAVAAKPQFDRHRPRRWVWSAKWRERRVQNIERKEERTLRQDTKPLFSDHAATQ